MPGSKEIRNKIKSVQNTRKITKAMEMVAASKMRKAQERTRAARPYAEKIRNVAAHLSHANPEYRHPYLVTRDTSKKVGIIVVTADKGLCGGLNTNVLRAVTNKLKEVEASGQKSEAVAIGNKGFMDDVDVKKILPFEHGLHAHLKTSHAALLKKIEDSKALDKDAEAELTTAITAFKKSFA